jgi:hypothetical protein
VGCSQLAKTEVIGGQEERAKRLEFKVAPTGIDPAPRGVGIRCGAFVFARVVVKTVVRLSPARGVSCELGARSIASASVRLYAPRHSNPGHLNTTLFACVRDCLSQLASKFASDP